MRRFRFLHSFVLVAVLACAGGYGFGAAVGAGEDRFSARKSVFGPEAQLAEFAHIERALREIDFDGPSARTSGWDNVPEAKWPFFALVYFGYAGRNLAERFPERQADVDSGAVVFGLGQSASGFALGAAAAMQDASLPEALERSAALVGKPKWRGNEFAFEGMPLVGQAVLLAGKTSLAAPSAER